ncbi:efflux RND transporter periplasmic adaptor subunit [uncultured Croceitalea sp.]|uniref:efflux RND transporter periplasmic adaptor subunit n=1 Tax=uncultured Croceitalea sp. TaxID=1798908 RepID=UPI0033061500
MIKKWSVYSVLILGGLLLGYLLFGTNKPSKTPKDELAIEAETGKWTCSMHPNIDGEEHGTCPLCAMDLVFVSKHPKALANNQIAMSEEATALANIQTTVVGMTDLDGISLKLSGTVTTNKKTDAVQTILFDGRIDALYPNYIGKKVRSGQEIGKVYSPELYLAQDKLLTSVSYKETHKSLYESARNTLGLWKMTDKQIDEMIALGKPMVKFPLYADVTGTVTEVLATEGNYYKQGDPLYRISDLRSVWVVLDVYEEQLQLLKVGQEVGLRFTALPNEVIVAKVSFVEPLLQKDKRTLAARILVENQNGKLKPGMFAEAQIIAKRKNKNILAIPKSAVLWTGKRSIVYKKPYQESAIFELVEVELGQSFTDSYEVVSGLAIDDEIVTNGAFTVDAAAQLMGKTSMMNKAKKVDHSFQMEESPTKDGRDPKPLIIENSITIEQLFGIYLELKDALVATDYKVAKQEILRLNTTLEVAHKNNATDMPSLKVVQEEMKTMMNATDIESLRKGFKSFSQDLIDVIRSAKNLPTTVYIQFCPMADEGKGASWLSLNDKIENPYFGDAMLHCGMVKEEIN